MFDRFQLQSVGSHFHELDPVAIGIPNPGLPIFVGTGFERVVKGDVLLAELMNDLLDVLHDQTKVVYSIRFRTRCRVLDGAWKNLEILVIRNPQTGYGNAASTRLVLMTGAVDTRQIAT
jgi:hypothetical protein